MKYWRQSLLLGFVFAAILITVIHSSCERNVCNGVNCFNGGSCGSSGTCLCPLGYEGPQCQSLSVTRYLGTYTGYINCDGTGFVFDTAIIATDGVAINTVSVSLTSIKPKVLHGYVSSNQATYSIVITNNDSLNTDSTIYDKTYTVTLQSDTTLSISSYTFIENKTDTVKVSQCSFLGQRIK